MAALVRLALDSGARLGELLALRWSDIDGTEVTIRRTVAADDGPTLRFDTPKNDKARKVELDVRTFGVLTKMRQRQDAEPVADMGGLVFRRPTSAGFQPWRPDSTTHAFQRQSKAAGVRVIAFHYLRHTCATWLLDAGMPVTEVSKRLGHWAPSFTLDRYSHTVAGRQRELASVVGDKLS